MNKTEEALIILAEECAEVVQECSKALRFGLDSEHDGETVHERLEKELGDIMCLYEIVVDMNLVDASMIAIAASRKREKLKKWSKLLE